MKKIALLLPIISGIMFGSAGVFVRTLSNAGLGNTTIIFLRASFAAVLLFLYIVLKDISLFKLNKRNVIWVICCALFGMMGTNLSYNISSTHLSLSLAAVLLSIAPVYTLIISRFLFGDKITGKKIVCVIMTIVGCTLVSGVIGTQVNFSTAGCIAGIVSGITYGLYSIFSKKGTESGLKGLTITFYCMVIIAIILVPFADFGAIGNYIMVNPMGRIPFLLFHSLCIGVIPYLLLTISMEYISPGIATILASCEPVAAMIFGVIFFSEIPTLLNICGLCITVAALIFLCKE